jgi:hypothetical protein
MADRHTWVLPVPMPWTCKGGTLLGRAIAARRWPGHSALAPARLGQDSHAKADLFSFMAGDAAAAAEPESGMSKQQQKPPAGRH